MSNKRSGWGLFVFCALFTLASWSALRAHEGEEGGASEEEGMPPRGPGEEGGPFTGNFMEGVGAKLKLSDAQRQKISAIVDASKADIKQKAEKLKSLREQMMAAHKDMQASVRSTSEKIRAELNDEQKEKFDMLKMRSRQGGRRWGPPGGGEGNSEMWQKNRGSGSKGEKEGGE